MPTEIQKYGLLFLCTVCPMRPPFAYFEGMRRVSDAFWPQTKHIFCKHLYQMYTNPGRQVAPNIFGSSVWNFVHFTFLAPRILRCFLDVWKICGP